MQTITLLKILTLAGLVATVIVLGVGIIGMFRAPSDTVKNNQMMRWRIILQGLTLVFFAALLCFGK